MQDLSAQKPESTLKPLPVPLLRLSKCLLRPFHSSDAASLVLAANTPNIRKWLSGVFPYPYSLSNAEYWLSADVQDADNDFAIVALDNVTVMGGISLKPLTDIHYRSVTVGYWVAEKYWGQGTMSEVVKAFCEKAFEIRPELLRIQAEVIDGNPGSGRVLEKAGFELECRRKWACEKNGVVYDCLEYVMLRKGC